MAYNYDKLNAEWQIAIARMANASGGGSAQDKLLEEIQSLVKLGYDPNVAADMVVKRRYDLKDDTDAKKAKNNTVMRISYLEAAMFEGDTDTALARINDWEKALINAKDMEYYDEDTIQGLIDYQNLCREYIQGKVTRADFDNRKSIIFTGRSQAGNALLSGLEGAKNTTGKVIGNAIANNNRE